MIAVFGPEVESLVEPLFDSVSQASLSKDSEQTVYYGIWKTTGEDVVIVRPGDNRLEIHCHGGHSAPPSIVESLIDVGFEKRSTEQLGGHLHGSIWLSETANALCRAPTEKTALILLRQYEIAQTAKKVPDPFLAIDWSDWGRHLTEPRSVVFCGQPNVGKSSLVNALAGFERTIVHETAGTTRDVISHATAIDGWPVELKDTAGLRSATSEIEQIGIGFAEDEIRNAEVVVAVFDSRQASMRESDWTWLKEIQPNVIVFNKRDLHADVDRLQADVEMLIDQQKDFENLSGPIATSAVTGEGMQKLQEAVSWHLSPELPPTGLLIPVTARQQVIMAELLSLLRNGEDSAATKYWESVVSPQL